jgi:hypothetical protein
MRLQDPYTKSENLPNDQKRFANRGRLQTTTFAR